LRLLVGLGNPGPRYAGTRHNVGFDAVDRILRSVGGRWSRATADAVVADIVLEAEPVMLLKPLTYMNLSGGPVAKVVDARELDCRDVLIFMDDVAIPLGTLRLRERGSAGGHNGLASVIEALGENGIPRVRIGVGSEEAPSDLADFVLAPFEAEERPVVDRTLDRVVEATRAILTEGMGKAMSRFNRPPESGIENQNGQGGRLA